MAPQQHSVVNLPDLPREWLMTIIAIANHKGGVGKTTTSVNLAAALAKKGKRVLLIDMDPQGHTTRNIGVELSDNQLIIGDVLNQYAIIDQVIGTTQVKNVDLAPAHYGMADLASELQGKPGSESRLRTALESLTYDFALIDCAPHQDHLVYNAFVACHGLIVPSQPTETSIEGLGHVDDLVATFASHGHKIRTLGIVWTSVKSRRAISRDIMTWLEKSSVGGRYPPFNAFIRESNDIVNSERECLPIVAWRPRSIGHNDYMAVASEVIERCKSAGI